MINKNKLLKARGKNISFVPVSYTHLDVYKRQEQERAEATHHSTAREAAQVAKMAGVSLLVLTLSLIHI